MRVSPTETQDLRATGRLRGLRIAVTTEAVLVFGQPVLAGGLLSGHYEMLAAHRYGAFATIAVAVVMTASAVRVRGVGEPHRLRLACALVVVVEAAQISWGYQRLLFVHIPLGVALATAIVALLVWVWRPADWDV